MSGRRMATVLRVRTLQERIARGEVGRRRGDLDAARRSEAAAWRDVQARSRLAPSAAARFVGHRGMLGGGVAEATDLAVHTAAAARAVDVALDAWRVQAQRLDGIERLVERMRLAAAAEEARREANAVDDLVVMRHRGGR